MKMIKRIGGFLLALAMVIALLPGAAAAEEAKQIIGSGTWGENIAWELDADGLLTVRGTGVMADNPQTAAWNASTWHQHKDRITAVVMEEGITGIGAYAFAACDKIRTVVIPEGVAVIGDHAFSNCTALEEITVPSTAETVGENVFGGSANLKRIVFTENGTQLLLEVEQFAVFSKDKTVLYLVLDQGGKDFVIPEGVVSVTDNAFSFCANVGKLTIPSTLKEIGAWGQISFTNSLSEIEVSSENPYFSSVDGKILLTEDGAELVLAVSGDGAVEIPAGVKKVRRDALCGAYRFLGDAPEFAAGAFKFRFSSGYDAPIYYPADMEGWHAVKEQFADIPLNWVAYDLHPVGEGKETVPMYRVYNQSSGEHFYTGSPAERDNLMEAGWVYEGIAWNAPVRTGDPVYRLFNPNANDHHYTMSARERDDLVELGWQYEGVAWNSAPTNGIPLHRLYNPNAVAGAHHYTGSEEERDDLVELGWQYEGIAWYSTVK